MEPGKSLSAIILASTAILFLIGCVSSKPTSEQQWHNSPQQIAQQFELHPIDSCIFACDHCFKEDALVKCANECIMTEASVGIEWTTVCPYLSKQTIHTFSSNPFRH